MLALPAKLGGLFEKWINGFLQEGATYPFMVPVLRNFVLPHAKAMAFLFFLFVGEKSPYHSLMPEKAK
jgi:hypothetical protein